MPASTSSRIFLHRAAEEEGVVHHDLQVLALGQLDQLLGLLRRRRERLLDEHVLAVLERRLRQLEVRPDRRDDGDGVDVRRRQDLGEVGRQLHAGIGPAGALAARPGSCRRPPRPRQFSRPWKFRTMFGPQ